MLPNNFPKWLCEFVLPLAEYENFSCSLFLPIFDTDVLVWNFSQFNVCVCVVSLVLVCILCGHFNQTAWCKTVSGDGNAQQGALKPVTDGMVNTVEISSNEMMEHWMETGGEKFKGKSKLLHCFYSLFEMDQGPQGWC